MTNKKQQQRQYTAAHKTAALVHFSCIQHWKGIYHSRNAQNPWKEERCLSGTKNSIQQEFWRDWVGMPALTSISVNTTKTTQGLKEGWALKKAKRPYRFNEKQKSFLVSKFNIGQYTGRKMDPEIVA